MMNCSLYIKILLFSLLTVSLASCEDNSDGILLEKIGDFAENNQNPVPTAQDYTDAGVAGVTEDIVDGLTDVVAKQKREDVDTVDELNLIVVKLRNNRPFAEDDVSSVILEVTDSDVAQLTPEELKATILLSAFDDDGDTLIYSIVEQPKYGELTLTNDTVAYTPNTNYNGPDSFTFRANDGIEDSNIAAVNFEVISTEDSVNYPCFSARSTVNKLVMKCGETDLTKIKKHLIWFNGTSEDFHDNGHLFANFKGEDFTVMKGWGIDPFWAGNKIWPSKIEGIADNSKVNNNIKNYVNHRLQHNLERIQNSDSLMIGGFSRGAAFFVPYFLKNLNDPMFLGSSFSNYTTSTKDLSLDQRVKKELIIYLMDPVHGSSNDQDETATTMKSHGFWSVEQKASMISDLKKRFKIKLIFMSAGFDMRQSSFPIDTGFYNHKDQFDALYVAKLGLAHSNMSVWSKDKAKSPKFGNNQQFFFRFDPHLDAPFWAAINKINPDLDITRRVFQTYLTGAPEGNVTTQDLENTIADYHQITEEWLGKNSSDWKRRLDYDGGYGYLEKRGYVFSGNYNTSLVNHSRLQIKKENNQLGIGEFFNQ